MTISFNLTKDDVVALSCHYYAASRAIRRNRLNLQVAMGTILGGGALLAVLSREPAPVVGVMLLVGAGLAVALIPSWYRRSLRRAAERMIQESSYQKAFGKYTLTLSEEGIASQSPTGEGKYTWAAVNSVALTPEHLFIFVVGPQGYAIPRAQLPDSTIQEVKAFAEAHSRSA